MSSTCYRIRIGGHLDQRWAAWFGEMTLSAEPDGTTVLVGPVADQSALHGLLQTIRDLGLPLLSVSPDAHDPQTTQATQSTEEPTP
ncbi:hypothetical protein [Nocardioides marmoribigeumensis]|uniref:Uncharacterized protein n=1 Tax=Nocardioides marmoribigeumensis TaxID=433649 RepID=A0ABU2BY74_9ACTN|nr:hypothetical protein [Nocardioides marmoribigeumensis]MDR7363342.1 hypothetical protein [Nocardioides marmoribigeumensis]